jgi:acyl dehydratase
MPIDPAQLLALDIPETVQVYTARDTILYALGVGLGQQPTDERQLPFVHEEGLQPLPSMVCVLANPPYWIRDHAKGIDWLKVVHGEQAFRMHQPLPPSGTVAAKIRVRDVIDKGAGKGALLVSERVVTDVKSGQAIATVTHTAFCRGEGGFTDAPRKTPPSPAPPQRAPDLVCDLPTRPESALLYRLSGDLNPLHALPSYAERAGYPQPILHGLASFGFAGHAILREVCSYDAGRITGMRGRFMAPVFPGETLRTEMWRDGPTVSFRTRVRERDVVVISNGLIELNGEDTA